MGAQENAALVRELHAAWNKRDFDRIAAVASDDCDWVMMPTGQHFKGQDGLRQYAQGWAQGFPDGTTEDTNVIAGDNGAMIEFIGRGTHTGTMSSPAGDVPPTGRTVALPLVEIYRITNGKVVGGSAYFDMVTLMVQLGLMPNPAAATA